MEDEHTIVMDLNSAFQLGNESTWKKSSSTSCARACFGIYDGTFVSDDFILPLSDDILCEGHGGVEAATFAKSHLLQNIVSNPSFATNPRKVQSCLRSPLEHY